MSMKGGRYSKFSLDLKGQITVISYLGNIYNFSLNDSRYRGLGRI